MIFSISANLNKASKIDPSKFTELNIWERQHIEEWVRTNPNMLGEELLIVSIEFDRFSNSNNRLDLLALDRLGNLVVIELKRDSTAGYADLQALRYAAMVSSMTIDVLTSYYISYRGKYYSENLSHSEAKAQIIEFVDSDSFTELSNRPRIILCSEGFSQEVTATVLWLRESDIDISCVTITPYKVKEEIIVVPKVIIPLAEAQQYLVKIKQKEDELKKKKISPRTMKVLVEKELIKAGDSILLRNKLPEHVKYQDGDPTFQATITGKLGKNNAVKWCKDGEEYSISVLTGKIFEYLHPEHINQGAINGNLHWVNCNGNSLWEIAQNYLANNL